MNVTSSEFTYSSSNTTNTRLPDSNLPFYRKLGRTSLTTSCLGLGGGGGISSEDTLYAFEQGINYFFFSSDLHHHQYQRMSRALRHLCARGSKVREKVVLATVTYVKSSEMALAALYDQFDELGLDYIDVFFWGWIGQNDGLALKDCLQISDDLRGRDCVYQRMIERIFGTSELMKKMGIVRYIGASFHDLNLAKKWINSPLLDVVMVRHNVAHRSSQNKIFNSLDVQDDERIGTVTFKSTGSHTGPLWLIPTGLPKGCWHPSVPDFYRYSLSQNCVDVCLTGLQNRKEIDEAIAGVKKGKLSAAEVDYLNLYGDLNRQRIKSQEISFDRLLFKTNK